MCTFPVGSVWACFFATENIVKRLDRLKGFVVIPAERKKPSLAPWLRFGIMPNFFGGPPNAFLIYVPVR